MTEDKQALQTLAKMASKPNKKFNAASQLLSVHSLLIKCLQVKPVLHGTSNYCSKQGMEEFRKESLVMLDPV